MDTVTSEVSTRVTDLEALGEFEMTQDIAAYRAAKPADDGARVTVNELRTDIDS